MNETSKCCKHRLQSGHFEKYLHGNGIDVGAGPDCLQVPDGEVRRWDIEDGDAMLLEGIADGTLDFLYSSHCLEHLIDVQVALKNWARVVRPQGYLYFVVPDFLLYERGCFPSLFNPTHLHTFSLLPLMLSRENHWPLMKMIAALDEAGCELLQAKLEDDNYDRTLLADPVDQTAMSEGRLAQICYIAQKR